MAAPTKIQALSFLCKSKILQSKRWLTDKFDSVEPYPSQSLKEDSQLASQHESELWTHDNPLERDLTAGKIQNLRIACHTLNGIIIPADHTFSFWRNLGRTTKGRGYVFGRELREGCIIPNIGGGLCQLSNALYDAALKANFQIVERHAHSKVIDGSLAAQDRDATVFWNYVDLRFKSSNSFQIEAYLSSDKLIVRFHHIGTPSEIKAEKSEQNCEQKSKSIDILGNCFSCGVSSCFRNQQQTAKTVFYGRTAALVDAVTPEFDLYLDQHLQDKDYLFSPINSKKFKAPAYAWSTLSNNVKTVHSTLIALRRAIKLRNIPKQGKALQSTLLKFDELLALSYAKKLDPSVSHLIIAQNLLPHLYKSGCLGGRTYDVLLTRLPLQTLESTLDSAARNHPESTTISDFRASSELLEIETAALKGARKFITPHAALAELFGDNVELLEWMQPRKNTAKPKRKPCENNTLKIFFPASPLARKGIYEVSSTLCKLDLDYELQILGRANEGSSNPLTEVNWTQANLGDLADADLVVLPAYVEHSPRLLLRALALGIPVIATHACGLLLQPTSTLTVIESPADFEQGLTNFLEQRASSTLAQV